MSSETDDMVPDGHRDKRRRVSSSEKSDIEEEVFTPALDWLNAGKNGEDLGSDKETESVDGVLEADMKKLLEDSSALPQFRVDDPEVLKTAIKGCAFFNFSPPGDAVQDPQDGDCMSQLSADSSIISSPHARRRGPDIFGTVFGASQSESYPGEQMQLSKTLTMCSSNIRDLVEREVGNERANNPFMVRKTFFGSFQLENPHCRVLTTPHVNSYAVSNLSLQQLVQSHEGSKGH
jgi:hypothetical protein